LGRIAAWSALHGALTWLAFPPAGLWPLAFLAPVPLIMAALLIEPLRGRARLSGLATLWAIGTLSWLALNAWLVQVTAAGLPALSVYSSAFGVLGACLLLQWRRLCGTLLPLAVLAPLAFGAAECLRALVLFDGYPWFRAGHPLVEWPMLVQACDMGGEVVASLLALCVSGGVVDAIAPQSRARRLGPALSIAALAAAGAYGAFRLSQAPTAPGPGILAIQTNLPTSNKLAWSPQQQMLDVTSFAQLTLEAGVATAKAGQPFALVAWPETMLGGYGLEPTTLELLEKGGYFPGRRFQRLASRLSDQLGAPLLVGSPVFIGMREEGEGWAWDRQFNSAYLVTGGPPPYERYDKLFLAPFGETMPYIRNWPALQNALLSIGAAGMTFDLHEGEAPVHFRVPYLTAAGQEATLRVAVPICFEDAMSWVCRDLVFTRGMDGRSRCADVMVNITNDGWFGWFDGGRAQHVQIARFRCIETRTPMVRVANTGLSVGIDSSGRIVAPPPAPRTAGWVLAAPPLDERTPAFVRIGDGVSWMLMGLNAFVAVAAAVIRRPPSVGAVALVAVALGAIGLPGCSDQQQAIQQQPWSSRDQTARPEGSPRITDAPPPSGPAIPIASSGGARGTAGSLLREATKSPVPVYRANAVEALGNSPEDLRLIATAMLADPNRGVRYVTAMCVGRAGLSEFADAVQPLLVDESASVRAAAIYALTKFGRPVDPTPLAAMAMSTDPEVRSNAYMVLGELGNPSALPIIRASLTKDMPMAGTARIRVVELQAAESMVRLGEVTQIEPIRAALFAPGDQNELTALAAQIAGRLKDEGSRPMLIRLIDASGESARPAEIRLTAAGALAELGPQDRAQIGKLAAAYIRDRDPIVRGQAALALVRASGSASLPELERMLFDPDAMVQLAAAKAVMIATRPR